MRKPGVLLVSPGIIRVEDRDFGLPHLVSLGGYLQQRTDVRVEIIDLAYESGDQRHLQQLLDSLAPFHCIGISCYSSFDYMRVMTVARFVKKLYPEVPLIAGGYHASAVPDDLLFDGSPFAVVVRGEGELALAELVETLLGGGQIESGICHGRPIEALDDLPPYRWELLSRYWQRAHEIGSKFQIYLSRGCPHHCTFCMERAKGEYRWRSFSPERALDELARLNAATDLRRFVVNVADPLFGFKRGWRRQVLAGICRRKIEPFQFWTLTRTDDLHPEDAELFARANFAIGIGLESGDPGMLKIMNKTRQPGRYLDNFLRLAAMSRDAGLNWGVNVVLGHPGETRSSLEQTRSFLEQLFCDGQPTKGWVSVDPFRLYPGSQVHEQQEHYRSEYGTRFHHPAWWHSWYDTTFRAEHLDPSSDLDYLGRLDFMYKHFASIIDKIDGRFSGQGTPVDTVYRRAIEEQQLLLSDSLKQRLLARYRAFLKNTPPANEPRTNSTQAMALSYPLGLQMRDRWVRRREEAVRLMLEKGLLRTESIVEALLQIGPERYLDDVAANAMLTDRMPPLRADHAAPTHLTLSIYATALETFLPQPGERAIDLMATSGYFGALLAHLVGPKGQVLLLSPVGHDQTVQLANTMIQLPNVEVLPTSMPWLEGTHDLLWLGAALPRLPASLIWHMHEQSRLITFLGPRYRAQEMVRIKSQGQGAQELSLGRVQVPVARGLGGWVRGV